MKRIPVTTVSLTGDANTVRALRKMAIEQNTRVGDLVRDALDAVYGEQLRVFDAPNVAHVHQDNVSTNRQQGK